MAALQAAVPLLEAESPDSAEVRCVVPRRGWRFQRSETDTPTRQILAKIAELTGALEAFNTVNAASAGQQHTNPPFCATTNVALTIGGFGRLRIGATHSQVLPKPRWVFPTGRGPGS